MHTLKWDGMGKAQRIWALLGGKWIACGDGSHL